MIDTLLEDLPKGSVLPLEDYLKLSVEEFLAWRHPDAPYFTFDRWQECAALEVPYELGQAYVDKWGYMWFTFPAADVHFSYRPVWCDRGRYGATVENRSRVEDVVNHADFFPRYFFSLERAFGELGDWARFNKERLSRPPTLSRQEEDALIREENERLSGPEDNPESIGIDSPINQ